MSLPRLSAHWRPQAARPLILGHRGASHAAPENTLAAFELASQEGAEGIEFDVRLNASGQVVVIHDATLSRVTQGADTRSIADLSAQQCAQIRVGKNQPLPTLEQVFNWSIARNACLNIELKSNSLVDLALADAVASELTQHRSCWPRVLVSSFNPLLVLKLRQSLPLIPGAWLIDSPALFKLPWHPKASAVHPDHHHLTEARVASWHRQGFRVHTWTVDDPNAALRLASWNVDVLITNQPSKILAALSH